MKILSTPIEFEWDKGNSGKNFKKHEVMNQECEEVFFDAKKRIAKDVLHSGNEARYFLIGQTKKERLLFIVFILRKKKVRVISARDLNKREYNFYEV